MENILIKNIGKLVQAGEDPVLKRGKAMGTLECMEDAYVYTEGDRIADYGLMRELPPALAEIEKRSADPHYEKSVRVIDASGRMVFPSFCDSHTHLVYAGSREREFTDKIRGLSYQEIARRGGGILNSARLLHRTSEEDLYKSALQRIDEIVCSGTGAVEIKSGYGLSTENELKMLRVIRRLKENAPVAVKATFLGAHAVPDRYKDNRRGYVDEIINTMIPLVAAEDLADYIDVFCEDGFFTVEDTDRILNAGLKYGLRAKVHANQMGLSGGVQVGVKYNAISVDHLENVEDKELETLCGSDTIATLLPGATFFLNMEYAPARRMIDRGIPVAIASNYNPGSCPSGSMQFEMALTCIKMKLTPEETINACTINGAWAMGLQEDYGSVTKGKKASLFITKPIPSYDFIPYAFTTPFIDIIVLNGKVI